MTRRRGGLLILPVRLFHSLHPASFAMSPVNNLHSLKIMIVLPAAFGIGGGRYRHL